MGEWRDTLLGFLQDDWKEHKDDWKKPRQSRTEFDKEPYLAAYIREQAQKAPRVRLKAAYAEYVAEPSRVSKRRFHATCLRIIQEQGLLNLGCLGRICGKSDLEVRRQGDKADRAYNQYIREALKEAAENSKNPGAEMDDGDIRAIAQEVLSGLSEKGARGSDTGEKGNLAALAMECMWDARAGRDALGSVQERENLLNNLRERSVKPKSSGAKAYRANWEEVEGFVGGELADKIESNVLPCVINQLSYTFLDNAANGRTYDIPIDLAEQCILNAAGLAFDLGITKQSDPIGPEPKSEPSAISPRDTKIEELRVLYWSLDPSADTQDYIVPVEIDSETGLGLYLMGPGFVRQINDQGETGPIDRMKKAFGVMPNAQDPYMKELGSRLMPKGRPFIEPFFAIMYRHEEYSNYDRSLDFIDSADGLTHVQNFWSLVVEAWLYSGEQSFKEAYERFDESRKRGNGCYAYSGWNDCAPEDCPERFRKFFWEDEI